MTRKDPLTENERSILRLVNITYGTWYNKNNFRMWSCSKEHLEMIKKEDEVIYSVFLGHVLIKK